MDFLTDEWDFFWPTLRLNLIFSTNLVVRSIISDLLGNPLFHPSAAFEGAKFTNTRLCRSRAG